jgi:twitching motility protein PilT
MPVLSSLLGIVDIKKAEGLILATDEVPVLLVAGASEPLTMPPLSASVLQAALDELLPPERRATVARAGEVEVIHDAGPLGTFALRVQVVGNKTTVTLRKVGGSTAAASPGAVATLPADSTAIRPPDSGDPGEEVHDRLLGAVLDQAIRRHASDVLLSPGLPPLLRVDGAWTDGDAATVTRSDVEQAFLPRLSPERQRLLAETGSVDLAFGRGGGGDTVRFRANLFRQQTGLAVALRPLWTALEGLAELNLPAALLPIVEVPHGLVVMTGATGSGKSTTLAALLEHVNRVRRCHIVTLEDPVEYVFRPRLSVIHQREVGTDVDGFASGLRAALRESPDIILVGEMRDRETIRLAMTAADTGHLVMSTLHSGTAALAIDRIVDAFDDTEKSEVRQQLAGSLRYVIAQQLLTAPQGNRIPVLEMLTVTTAVAAQIREGRTHLLAAQMEIEAGERMVSMERALADLVRGGRLGRQAALDAALHPEEMRRLLDDRAASGRR